MKHSGGSCEIKLSAPAFFTTRKQDRHNWESKKAKTQNKNPELQYLPSFSHLHWPCCLALAQCKKTAPRTRENHSLARRRKGFWLEIDAKASQANSSPHHSPHAFNPNTKEHCTAGEQNLWQLRQVWRDLEVWLEPSALRPWRITCPENSRENQLPFQDQN